MDVTTVDPYTSTREEYTNALLQQQIPDDAPDKLVAYAVDLRELVRKLAFHPAMVESGNMAQTFMTPALSKNKVYCKNITPHTSSICSQLSFHT
jgi:hypothetical protein